MATAAQNSHNSESLVLTPYEPRELTTPEQVAELIKSGASLDSLKQYMDLKERYEANEARKAFVEAKSRFFAENIIVSKDKENKQYGSRYTTLGNLVNTVRPFLGKHEFDARWEVEQGEEIKVTCVLTHRMGHSERVWMKVKPDTSGAKNSIQQIKSAITYARNLTFEAVCGLASTDENVNLDDDGNHAGSPSAAMSDELYVQHLDNIENASNVDELKTLYFAAQQAAGNDDKAKGAFSKAKNARWRELNVSR